MIRLTELKLPLSALPVVVQRAADAPAETEADRAPAPHPLPTLRELSARVLGVEVGQHRKPASVQTQFRRAQGGIAGGVHC
jgi:hypothetical protein